MKKFIEGIWISLASQILQENEKRLQKEQQRQRKVEEKMEQWWHKQEFKKSMWDKQECGDEGNLMLLLSKVYTLC